MSVASSSFAISAGSMSTTILLAFFAPESFVGKMFLLLIGLPIIISPIIFQVTEFYRKYDAITFTSQQIEMGKETFLKINYADIQKIVLDYCAKKKDYAYPFWIRSGHENILKVITKNEKKTVKNVLLEKEIDVYRFWLLGDFLKERGIEVEMKNFPKDKWWILRKDQYVRINGNLINP